MRNQNILLIFFHSFKYSLLCGCFLLASVSADAQFKPTEKGLTIMVTDGTDRGKNSELQSKNDIPTSYDVIVTNKAGKGGAKTKNRIVFTDPINELGMTDCIQAAAFLERPKYGKAGFMLVFSINDAIGGKQGTLLMNGVEYKGVYRIIRQKNGNDQPTPEGMAIYKIEGTFFLLGMS